MGADAIKFNIDFLNEQITPIGMMTLKSRANFRNIILQIQDFDRYCVYVYISVKIMHNIY